ncbi:MAG: DUF2497 domain-containing protein [Alphaproteobacteria bacterium]|nr:DUF2497 domain-containing protein [Alphaproteobacteria bacterium]
MTEQVDTQSMAQIMASIKNILSEEDEKVDAIDAKEAQENKEKAAFSVKDFEDPHAKVKDPEPETEDSREEKVVELTSEMVIEEEPAEVKSEDKKSEEPVVEVKKEEKIEQPVSEAVEEDEEDYKPVPVIPAEDVVEEDLSNLMAEQDESVASIDNDDESLMSGSAIEAATSSLSALKSIADDERLSLGHGGLTIEIIVRETLKPLLREWLNKNLPPIVERVVKKEVAHIIDRLNIK